MSRHISFNDTHIYIESLSADIEQIIQKCNKETIEKINQATSPRRKREIAMTHLLIKKHIGEHAQLCHNEVGAPYIKNHDCFISITHSASHIALAINHNHPIGIDMENWREQLISVKTKFLSEKEISLYSSPQQLLQAWTIKEALYKVAQSPGISFSNDIILPTNLKCNIAKVNTLAGLCDFTFHIIESSPEYCISLAQPF